MAQGKVAEAFADFRQLDLARQWHLEVLPADATRISSEVRLQQIYASFIDTGNRLYFSAGRAELARETFRAAEENRASSLYQLLSEAGDWRRRLPAGYWEKLAKLHVVEVAMLRQDTGALRSRMASLRSEILEEEAEAGSDTQAGGDHLLERTQSTLPADAVLLSFHLGECESDLWAVSREQFRIYRLKGCAWDHHRSLRRRSAERQSSTSSANTGSTTLRRSFWPAGSAARAQTAMDPGIGRELVPGSIRRW
ncbi:MAG: hypothetical protein DMG57_21470 [Acidobacteria bacterium]|nr:MAG: hypothetical protein DMG57_21470 [Acidobacteriota bacterium]